MSDYKVTVNIQVEIDGKVYKASNGASVTVEVFKNDVLNIANLGLRQIIAQSGLRDVTESPVAQDAIVDDQ